MEQLNNQTEDYKHTSFSLADDFRAVPHPTQSTKEIARLLLEMGSENARNYDLAKYFERKSQHLFDDNQLLLGRIAKLEEKLEGARKDWVYVNELLESERNKVKEVCASEYELKMKVKELNKKLRYPKKLYSKL